MDRLPYEAPVNQRGLSEDSFLLEIIKRFYFEEIVFFLSETRLRTNKFEFEEIENQQV